MFRFAAAFRFVAPFVLVFLCYVACAVEDLPTKESLLKLLPKDSYVGSVNAPITVIEYHSVTCPHCSYFNASVKPKIKNAYVDTGKVLYITREYPVDEQSFNATLMMYCMPKEKVDAFRAVLFASQRDWWGKKNYLELFNLYASLGGIDSQAMSKCTQSTEVRDRVFQDKLLAIKVMGIGGVPMFFVNGKKYEGARPWEYWDSLLSELDRQLAVSREASKAASSLKEPCPNNNANSNKD